MQRECVHCNTRRECSLLQIDEWITFLDVDYCVFIINHLFHRKLYWISGQDLSKYRDFHLNHFDRMISCGISSYSRILSQSPLYSTNSDWLPDSEHLSHLLRVIPLNNCGISKFTYFYAHYGVNTFSLQNYVSFD